MKVVKVLFLFFPMILHAKTQFLIGPEASSLDVSSSSDTILSFPKRPISSSCQPGDVSFKTLKEEGGMSFVEKRLLEEKDIQTTSISNTRLGLFLKMTPLKKTGKCSCVFSLEDGSQVPISFNLKKEISRPLVEFIHPPPSDQKNSIKDKVLEANRAMVSDKNMRKIPVGYAVVKLDKSKKYFKTSKGRYKIEFLAKNDSLTIAKVEINILEETNYKLLSLLKQQKNFVNSSLVLPQKHFKKGDQARLYLTFHGSLSVDEIFMVLP
jgi:hypothetical protein